MKILDSPPHLLVLLNMMLKDLKSSYSNYLTFKYKFILFFIKLICIC